jgi:hypothetical protein
MVGTAGCKAVFEFAWQSIAAAQQVVEGVA